MQGEKDLLDHLPVVVWEAGFPGYHLHFISRSVEPLLGYPHESWTRSPVLWLERIVQGDRERVRAVLRRVRLSGQPQEVEYGMLAADGTVRRLHDRVQPSRDLDGGLRGLRGAIRDVTELRESERRRLESEQAFRHLAEHTNDVFWLRTTTGLSYVSPSFEKVWDRSAAVLYRSPDELLEAVHPEDKAQVAVALGAPGEEGTFSAEFRIQRRDGATRWIQARVHRELGAEGELVREVGIAADVTEQRLAQVQLRETNERLTLALESARSHPWDWSVDSRFVTVPPALARQYHLFGRGRRVPTAQIWPLIPRKDRRAFVGALREHLRGQSEVLEGVFRLRDVEGTRRWLRVRGRSVPGLAGGRRITGIALDVTGQRQEEAAALAAQERRLLQDRNLFELASWPRRGTPDQVQDFLRRCAQVAAEVLGTEVAELWLPASESRLGCQVRVNREGAELKTESWFEGPVDARLRPLLEVQPLLDELGRSRALIDAAWLSRWGGGPPGTTLAAPLRQQARVAGMVMVSAPMGRLWHADEQHFISSLADLVSVALEENARLRAEDSMAQAQKLESLGVLAGGVAHDFNNLLGTIIGNAEQLAALPDKAGEAARRVLKASERAASLCRLMLDYSGKGRFVTVGVDLGQEVRDTIELLLTTALSASDLEVEVADELPLISGDSAQIRQLVLNLLTNAADAMQGREGAVRVSVRAHSIDHEWLAGTVVESDLLPGTHVLLRVEDAGCGMSSETLERIFDPFFTTKSHGRGLGMAAVLGIVRSHGAAIRVESQPESGTVFEVALPLPERPLERTLEPVGPPAAVEPATILLVDDDELLRESIGEMLRGLGYSVLAASGGAEALEHLEGEPERLPDALLLDLSMPGMDGRAVLRRLEAREGGLPLPVLLMSGFDASEAADEVAPGGLVRFLRKPFRSRQLGHELTALLRLARERSGAEPA